MNGSFAQLKLALVSLGHYEEHGQQLRFNCPICEKLGSHNKHNLEVRYMNQPWGGLSHCWACGYSGSAYKVIRDYGNRDYLPLFSGESLHLEEEKPKLSFELPKHIINVLNHTEATTYLLSRGLTKEKIRERQIKYCYAGKLKECILFPSFNSKGELTACIIHHYKQFRYEIRKNSNFVLFYETFIDKQSPIILVEGVYDALVIPNAIPILGTSISEELITFLSNTSVIYAPDKDVKPSLQVEIIKKLESVCKKVNYYKQFPLYKDINETYIKNKIVLVNSLKQFYSTNI